MKRARRGIVRTILILLIANAALLLLWSRGLLALNHPRQAVRGVDVSHYQGDIDWPTLAGQGIQFAFIKATEGSGSRDERFAENWRGARAAGLRAGAYHFFSFGSPGAAQAANFIASVPAEADALPPAIDVEGYGRYRFRLPEAEFVIPELTAVIDALREAYGKSPVLYCDRTVYRKYIMGRFDDCGIWMRDLIDEPVLPDGRPWTFWQFTGRGCLRGYRGEERFIDINVFSGTQAEFDAYAVP